MKKRVTPTLVFQRDRELALRPPMLPPMVMMIAVVASACQSGRSGEHADQRAEREVLEARDGAKTANVPLLVGGSLRVHAPARATGALHIEAAEGISLDVQATGARDVEGVRAADGSVVYQGAFDDTRLVHLASEGRTEEVRRVTKPGMRALRYSIRLGEGLSRLRVVDDYVEALDRRGVARLRTEPAFMIDARGHRRELRPVAQAAHGETTWSLTYAIDDRGLDYPLDIDPAWTVTTSLAKARRDPTLTVLPSGKVVAIGGQSITAAMISSIEIWDPTTSSWTSGGSLTKGRGYHASVLLASGKILVVGGAGGPSAPDVGKSAELYDPATATSTLIATLAPDVIGSYVSAFEVSTGQALTVGAATSFLLDVGAGAWTTTAFTDPRTYGAAVMLPSGKVLAVGGDNADSTASLSSAEIFDPALKAWKAVAPMKSIRTRAEAQMLTSGKVLVAGGNGLSTAELYDPTANTWTAAPSMSSVHAFGGSVVLPSKKILVFAGDLTDGLTDATDLYDPTTSTWSFAGRIAAPRDEFGFAVLPSGKVMIAGGSNGSPVPIVEIFDLLAKGQPCLGPGECSSGFCVEAFCCEKSACAAGETCAGAGVPGTCSKKNAASCATDAECGSAHCVDGVCCDSSCTDACGACDVKGKEGACVAVAAGDAPHGARAACPGTDVCRARCGGVDKAKCTQLPGTAIVCAKATCDAGHGMRARGCDGAGGCAPAAAVTCSPYVCGDAECKTKCEGDKDCVEGNTCDLVSSKCVIAATCDRDHTVTSPDGKTKDCTPFRCSGARCIETCADSSACTTGFVCDTATSRCVAGSATGTGDSGGGCSLGGSSTNEPYLLLVTLFAFFRRTTGRRSRRRYGPPTP